jgi:hemerythrin-like domain-containing protein
MEGYAAMPKALDMIRAEHRNIGRILDALAMLGDELAAGKSVLNWDLLHAIIYYMRVFPDNLHHPKEERHLFAALLKRAPAAVDTIAILKVEHFEGVARLKAIADLVAVAERAYPDARQALGIAIAAYVDFERRHMRREETEILPLAEQCLREEDWRDIGRAFAVHSDPVFGDNLAVGFEALHRYVVEHATVTGLGNARRLTPSRLRATGPRTR